MPPQNTTMMIIPILPWTLRYHRHNARSITLPKDMTTKTLDDVHLHQRTEFDTALDALHEHLPIGHVVTRCTQSDTTNKCPDLQHCYDTCTEERTDISMPSVLLGEQTCRQEMLSGLDLHHSRRRNLVDADDASELLLPFDDLLLPHDTLGGRSGLDCCFLMTTSSI